MPPGSNMITGVPLLLLTAQMVLGFSHVRLPDFIDRRPVPRRGFQRAVLRLRPVLRPLERIIRPRLERSEEHTSELQSLMRISYAVFCLKKKNKTIKCITH